MWPRKPLFWTSGDVFLRFQSQGKSLFACFFACVILRFTSSVTPAGCVMVSMAAEPFRSMYYQTCPQVLMEVRAGARTRDNLIKILNHLHILIQICHFLAGKKSYGIYFLTWIETKFA